MFFSYTMKMSELSTLWDLFHTAQQLRNVRLHVAADIGAKLPLNSECNLLIVF